MDYMKVANYGAGGHRDPGDEGNVALCDPNHTASEAFHHLIGFQIGNQIDLDVDDTGYAHAVMTSVLLEVRETTIDVRRQSVRCIPQTNYRRLILVTRWTYPTHTRRLNAAALLMQQRNPSPGTLPSNLGRRRDG